MRHLWGLVILLASAAHAGPTGKASPVRLPASPVPAVAAVSAVLSNTGIHIGLPNLPGAPAPLPGLNAVLQPSLGAPAVPGAPALTLTAPAEESLARMQEALHAPSGEGAQAALAESSRLFDRQAPNGEAGVDATPEGLAAAGLADALDRIFAEHPGAAEALSQRVRASAYGSAIREGAWKADLVAILRPWMEARAEQVGFPTLSRYLAFVRGDEADSAAERKGLADLLVGHTEHRAEEWTYIFRDYPLWKEPLARYLDGLVAQRSGSKRLDLQSVGAGYGSESYSLAIMVEQALRRAGQDPAAWRVSIKAYDISFLSLLTTGRALYRRTERDAKVFAALGLEGYFDARPGGLLQLKEPLAGWIKPAWVDLDDPRQHRIVTRQKADVVFANYLLYHLRTEPAHALADHWLAGRWSRHGFLSMAQVAVGEVGESRLEPADIAGRNFIGYHYGGNIGWAGRAFFGDDFGSRGGVFTNWWRKLRHPAGKAVLAAGLSFLSQLTHDPFNSAQADEGMLAFIAETARRTGLEIVLTTESILAHREGGRLHLNIGWVLAEKADRSLLERFIEEETGRGPGRRPSVPDALRSGVGGRGRGPLPGGPGSVIGRTEEGALLKFTRRGSSTWIEWLTGRFIPISIGFHSDNTAKLLHGGEAGPAAKPAGRPAVRVYGLE
ncbi:MAG: hypothetical protein HY927_05655 [Elusimicrobia bacterium]|nr:hypothetical protein [Elusimicrobiota bacterium]